MNQFPDDKPNWKGLIQSLGCTHFITLNPLVPGLRQHEALKLGETLAKRLKDRAGLPSGSVILIPEQCSQGFWHYHGFVKVTDASQANFLNTCVCLWIYRQCAVLSEASRGPAQGSASHG